MNISFSPPDIGYEEVEEVSKALLSGWITTGPRTKELERQIARFCNTDRAVCLNSATACMELVLHVLGIGEGDEVITTAYTYSASASVIRHVGAKVVLVDTQTNSYEMDYSKLAEAITSKTKAIIPVDLGGVICDYVEVYKIIEAKRQLFSPRNDIQQVFNRIVIIEDAAHAFGAKQNGKMAGEISDFTSFSFHAVKNFTTAEGGALVWRNIDGIDNDWLYNQFMLLSLHGQSKDALAKTQIGAWEYDILSTAYKCNMTDIVAAIGLVQMKRYDSLLEKRRQIIEKYNSVLSNYNLHVLSHYGSDYTSSGHLYMVRLLNRDEKRRNEIIIQMAKDGIACNVHYKPLPMMTAYKNLGFDIKDFPNAYGMYKNEITLPLHTKLTDEEVDYVTKCFTKYI